MNSALLALLGARVASATPAGADLTFTEAREVLTRGGTHTLAGVNIGTASATRTVVVAFACRRGGVATGVTIGGAAATIDAAAAVTDGNSVTIARANVPTGATADIVVTGGTMWRIGAGVWWAPTALTVIDADAAAGSSVALTCPAGSALIAVTGQTSTAKSLTWTGATESFNNSYNSVSGADGAAGLNPTITATFTDSENQGTAAVAYAAA